MIHEIKNKDGLSTRKQRLNIPDFDLYSKEVEKYVANQIESQVWKRNQDISWKINNVKRLLRKTSEENINDIKFIPYGLDSMTQNDTMRKIITQHNLFLNAIKVVPVFGRISKDKDQVKDIISKSLYFTGMEPTRKSDSEGKYLLVTTQNKLYCAQRDVDNLLGKYYNEPNIWKSKWNTRVTKNYWYKITYQLMQPLKKNNLINKTTPTLSSPLTYYQPVTIYFTTNSEK